MRWHRCIALLTFYLAATAAIQDGPHQCSTTQPVQVYKVNDETWCEKFCIPTSLVKTVEQFGDVHNGSCTQHAYTVFDYSLQTYLYGVNITVDMYKKSSAADIADTAVGWVCLSDETKAPFKYVCESRCNQASPHGCYPTRQQCEAACQAESNHPNTYDCYQCNSTA